MCDKNRLQNTSRTCCTITQHCVNIVSKINVRLLLLHSMNDFSFSFTVTQWHQLLSQTKASCATSAGHCTCACVCVCVVWGGKWLCSIHSAYSPYTQCQTGSQTAFLFSVLPLPFLEFVLKYPRPHFSLSFSLYDCLLSEFKWFVGTACLTSLLGNGLQEGIRSPQ